MHVKLYFLYVVKHSARKSIRCYVIKAQSAITIPTATASPCSHHHSLSMIQSHDQKYDLDLAKHAHLVLFHHSPTISALYVHMSDIPLLLASVEHHQSARFKPSIFCSSQTKKSESPSNAILDNYQTILPITHERVMYPIETYLPTQPEAVGMHQSCFYPKDGLMPVLPPTLESTCDNNVVGT